jgi:hypothetical protein
MGAPNRLTGALAGLAIVLLAMPVALIATLVAIPFWSWLESAYGIEAIGHSGPAEWCYLVTWLAVISVGGIIWSASRGRTKP